MTITAPELDALVDVAPKTAAPAAITECWGPAELICESRRLYNLSLVGDNGELLARAGVLASLAGAMATEDHEQHTRQRFFSAHGCAV